MNSLCCLLSGGRRGILQKAEFKLRELCDVLGNLDRIISIRADLLRKIQRGPVVTSIMKSPKL